MEHYKKKLEDMGLLRRQVGLTHTHRNAQKPLGQQPDSLSLCVCVCVPSEQADGGEEHGAGAEQHGPGGGAPQGQRC